MSTLTVTHISTHNSNFNTKFIPERVCGIFINMEEKELGKVVYKGGKVNGFIKAVPPPICINQFIDEDEYLRKCRTEDTSSLTDKVPSFQRGPRGTEGTK